VRESPSSRSDWSPSEASSTGGSAGRAALPPPAETLPPELVDHPDYEIVRELGRGGMGVVFLVNNRLMGRPEVLKVVGRHLVERPGVLDRFLREIRSAAMLQHANIVTAYSAMRVGSSVVLAMEYVEGLDLAKIVKTRGPLPVAHACYFIYQVALGLQHAHERGMVHRDIKPANLIVAREGKKSVVKVLDFGLAKVTSEGQTDSGLTREGQMLGTPDFIAPEQIRDAQSADIRADIYSLGCTFYYLLTGGPPFHGDHLWDLYQAHFSREADPLNLVRPEVPVELAALVAKMLAKEPVRRFQTPGELAPLLTPFFKSGAMSSARPNAMGPRVKLPAAAIVISEIGLPPTESAIARAGPAPAKRQTPKKAPEEIAWTSLIEFKETELSKVPIKPKPRMSKPAPSPGPVRRPPWLWPVVASGVLLCGLIIAGAIVFTRVTDPDGNVLRKGLPALERRPLFDDGKPPTNLTDQRRFVSHLTGNDLTGWKIDRGNPALWRIAGGVLVANPMGAPPEVSYLVSEREYSDFVMRFQFQLAPDTNSGISFRSLPGERPYPPEISLRNFADGHAPSGALGWRATSRADDFLLPDEPAILGPPSAWNSMEIQLRDDTLTVYVEGKKLSSFDLHEIAGRPGAHAGFKRRSGHIGFQSVAGTARFRNIEIKDLSQTSRAAVQR
jgi:serine/threonine protein kinase